jgi:hypothetical protein
MGVLLFSVQFRENLEVARKLYPDDDDDDRLRQLDQGERTPITFLRGPVLLLRN